jgi:hypothetical protein
VAVEDEDWAESAAHFLHEGFEGGVVFAEDGGDFLEGGAVEFVAGDGLGLDGGDDGGGTVFEAAERVEGAAALGWRELGPEREELVRGGCEAGECFFADIRLRRLEGRQEEVGSFAAEFAECAEDRDGRLRDCEVGEVGFECCQSEGRDDLEGHGGVGTEEFACLFRDERGEDAGVEAGALAEERLERFRFGDEAGEGRLHFRGVGCFREAEDFLISGRVGEGSNEGGYARG